MSLIEEWRPKQSKVHQTNCGTLVTDSDEYTNKCNDITDITTTIFTALTTEEKKSELNVVGDDNNKPQRDQRNRPNSVTGKFVHFDDTGL